MTPTVGCSPKIRVSYDDYEAMIETAKTINANTDNPEIREKRKKFIPRYDIPTVGDLIVHDVPNKIEQFLPYLAYYEDPEICIIKPEDPDYEMKTKRLQKLRQFIRQLYKERIEFT